MAALIGSLRWQSLIAGLELSLTFFSLGYLLKLCKVAHMTFFSLGYLLKLCKAAHMTFFSLGYLLKLCKAAHMLDELLDELSCLALPSLAFCQSPPLFFFDNIMEWIPRILHRR